MGAPYTVTWVYLDGNPHTRDFSRFDDALLFYRDRAELGACKGAVSIAADGCEHDGERWHDGLTDEEREQL